MRIALFSHPDCVRHAMGPDHPESPARLRAVEDRLRHSGLPAMLEPHDAPLAPVLALERVHDAGYLRSLAGALPGTGMVWLDPDTAMNAHTYQAALRAAGAALAATDLVMAEQARTAFCNVRPPGHHAERGRAMGFCFLNNVAVAAAHALGQHGLERVAIVDFDVHHGNGTEDIFRDDPRVMMVSTFQHPLYPGSGLEGRSERMVNVPLAAGCGSRGFRQAVLTHWLPALDAFAPRMLFVSAGFDAHLADPLGSLGLTEADYAWVTRELVAVAARHAQGRIVSVLEGGYHLDALGRSAAAHVRALAGL